MRIDYDEKFDILYVSTKDEAYKHHYVDGCTDEKHVSFCRSFDNDEIVGAMISRASEWFEKYLAGVETYHQICEDLREGSVF